MTTSINTEATYEVGHELVAQFEMLETYLGYDPSRSRIDEAEAANIQDEVEGMLELLATEREGTLLYKNTYEDVVELLGRLSELF